MATPTETALADSVTAPRRVRIDNREAESQPLQDLIAADKYQRAQTAVKQPSRGILWQRVSPPGAN